MVRMNCKRVILDNGMGNKLVTVHSHIFVGFFLSCMKICLHKCAKGAPVHEQK